MTEPRVLIACIGNIFLGDDGFGVEVASRLAATTLPPGVVVKDFGIRGLDLTYTLLDPFELVILVDACPRGGEPGTVYVIEPDPSLDLPASNTMFEPHAMNPLQVLNAVKELGGQAARMLIVGCEPLDCGGEEGKMGLSKPVAEAVDEAVRVIESIYSRILSKEMSCQTS